MPSRPPKKDSREYLLEFQRQGSYVRVAALDPATSTEIVMVGSAAASRDELTRLAVRKLEYVLAKKQERAR